MIAVVFLYVQHRAQIGRTGAVGFYTMSGLSLLLVGGVTPGRGDDWLRRVEPGDRLPIPR